MEHVCQWRSFTEWRSEPEANGWQIWRQQREQRCQECGREKGVRPTDRQRRSRVSISPEAAPPENLLTVVSTRQWRPLSRLLQASGVNRRELEAMLEQWLQQGWLEVEEHREPDTRRWCIEKARLSAAAYAQWVEQPQADRQERQAQARLTTLARLDGWEADLARARLRWPADSEVGTLLQWLDLILREQSRALSAGSWLPLPGTGQQPGGAPHQRWLHILRGLLALLAADGWEYERAFSARWLDDSKQLARERSQFENYLGVTLERLGLFRHTPVVYCWGPFMADCGGLMVDGRAGTPFVALTTGTVQSLTRVQVSARAVLVVENQTAFERVLRPPLRQADLLYLYSGGHAGYAERELLAVWLRTAPALPWYVWTDWDVGGVRIQADWAGWAQRHDLIAPHPWQWDDAALARWQILGTPLTDTDQVNLRALRHPLAERLLSAGFKLEQEAILGELTVQNLRLG